ncbi:DUF2057 family protein [Shewanella saliphila]|uniref:DUF2057 domain-containing protein n=1 Tax=Shewanella saliphila TaxID=2282698 RepID=A0ABQ2Q6G1_9GAMM|nr:DUF2057 family protein [Shewanella saliphila]MCL1101431.1 DUF2057 domain-containing protein [Shewanella saliphila]GGP48379.1 hypothetical protein GCM10009409_13800 [Shewanella saliphila]
MKLLTSNAITPKSVFRTAIISFSLLFGAQVQASSLTVPDSLVVETVNGESVSLDSTVGLKRGQQLVEINYRDLFQDNADDSGYWVRSKPLYLTLNVANNQRYEIITPTIYSAEEAREFLDNPQVKLTINGEHHDDVELLTQAKLLTQLLLK